MSYRRHSEKERRWNTFRDANLALAGAAGLPEGYLGKEEIFLEFLDHGHLDHHEDPSRFEISTISPDQHQSFLLLVRNYFSAGFPYFTPMALHRTGDQEELDRLFRKS